jgi:hypothetical protein
MGGILRVSRLRYLLLVNLTGPEQPLVNMTVRNRYPTILQFLINKGAGAHTRAPYLDSDHNEGTLLHIAAEKGANYNILLLKRIIPHPTRQLRHPH